MERFILNDETVENSHGFILSNNGGRWDRFDGNPIMLFNHKDDFVLGKWKDRAVEGKQLTLSPVFDMDDTESARIAGKVKRGFINGASLGIIIHNAVLLEVDGRYIPFVDDWTAVEASIAPIPSNEKALALRIYDEKGNELSPSQVKLNLNMLTDTKHNSNSMDKILLTADAYTKLGLTGGADGAAISAAIVALHTKAEGSENELNTLKQTRATDLVTLAITEGRITAESKDDFTKMAVNDYSHAKNILNGLPTKASLAHSAEVSQGGLMAGIPADRASWSYLRWLKEDPKGAAKLRVEHPETFAKLKADYGK